MKLFIAGHRGMVGSALIRRFQSEPDVILVLRDREELDLTNQREVESFFQSEKPDAAIIAAARVGGIHANASFPAEFIYENLAIASNATHAAFRAGTARLLFLGSSCIYPKEAPQPMSEDCLLTSALERTNEAYAIAKIAGLKLCEFYRRQYGILFHSVMPTNLYGPGDNYHLLNSHVLPAFIRRFHEAAATGQPEVVAWGSGLARREFLHVDDLADACAFILRIANPPDRLNVGTGVDITIRELAMTVAAVTGFKGNILWDAAKPDGPPRKLLNVTMLRNLGWSASIDLHQGLERTYASFLVETKSGILRT